MVHNRRLSPKCEDFINNIDDNIIENISLILENESIDTKARVTKSTDMLKYQFLDTAASKFGHVREPVTDITKGQRTPSDLYALSISRPKQCMLEINLHIIR